MDRPSILYRLQMLFLIAVCVALGVGTYVLIILFALSR